MLTLAMLVLTGLPAAQAKDDPIPQKLELFAKEEWYRGQKGEEQQFTGLLERVNQPKGTVGIGRFNPYRLTGVNGKKETREVYVGGKPDLLAPYVGKRVVLTGKAVEMEVVGRDHREIWPARLEVVRLPGREESPANPAKEGNEQAAGQQLKVVAQGAWPYAKATPNDARGGQQFVVRSAAELVAKSPFAQSDMVPEAAEKKATEAIAAALKVERIDWKTQMLVVVTAGSRPTGGYQLEIKGLTVEEKTLTVRWLLTPPRGAVTQAFTHPARMALVERFDGAVKFESLAPKLERPIKPRQLPLDRVRPLPPEFLPERVIEDRR